MNLLVAHDVGLPEIVRADDDTIPLELLASLKRFLFCYRRHATRSRFLLVSNIGQS
jgi:hypothetical protein